MKRWAALLVACFFLVSTTQAREPIRLANDETRCGQHRWPHGFWHKSFYLKDLRNGSGPGGHENGGGGGLDS